MQKCKNANKGGEIQKLQQQNLRNPKKTGKIFQKSQNLKKINEKD